MPLNKKRENTSKRKKKMIHPDLNLNSLLVKRQIDNPSPGAVTGGNKSIALTREVNFDTLSSDSSEEEIRDSGRSFQSMIVWERSYTYRHLYWLRVSERPRSADSCHA